MSPKELIQRGEEVYHRVYEGTLREQIEKIAWGRFVIINVDTGAYLLADFRAEALSQFHAQFPSAPSYVFRIGVLPLVA